MKKLINYLHHDLYAELFGVLLIIAAFFVSAPTDVISGFGEILISPSILLTDYVYVGGLGATLLNVGIMLLVNIFMIKRLKLAMSGPVYACLMILVGFSFFGKNILNTIPIYLGIWLFAKRKHIPFKSLIISILLSSGLGPLVSYAMFGFGLEYYVSIPLGIICGVAAGFVIPSFAAHTLSFHEGYNLYNTGFALGIIAAVFNGIFSLFDLKSETLGYLQGFDDKNQIIFYIYLYGVAVFFIAAALIKNKNAFTEYRKLLKTTGRLVANYIRDFSVEAVMINYAVLSIAIATIMLVFRVPMNGIIFGSIISILGCASFGLHIRNTYPIWIGCAIAIAIKLIMQGNLAIIDNKLIFNFTVGEHCSLIVAFIFATGLAPICGKYGFVYGLVGGMIHMIFTPLVLPLQGGFDLYNNGFSAGFEGALVVVCAEKVFNREKKYARKSKNM